MGFELPVANELARRSGGETSALAMQKSWVQIQPLPVEKKQVSEKYSVYSAYNTHWSVRAETN